MRLMFAIVWYTMILSYSASVPRPKHPHIKYLATNLQDKGELTALEVLEGQLLHKRNMQKSRLQPHKKTRLKRMGAPDSPLGSAPVTLDSCSAAFGVGSPLCRKIRISKNQSKNHKKRSFQFGVNTMQSSKSPEFEDFFGIFNSSTVSIYSRSDQNLYSNQSVTVTPFTSNAHPIPNNGVISKDSTAHAFIVDKFKPLFENDEKAGVKRRRFYKQEEGEGGGAHLPELLATTEEIPSEETTSHGESETAAEHSSVESTPLEHATETTIETPGQSEHGTETQHIVESHPLTQDTQSKSKCESESGKKCVCSFESLNQDYRNIFSKAVNSRHAVEEIANMHCSHYKPIVSGFNLSPHAKPNVLSANKKPMAVDGENGSKEIEEGSLIRFIKESASFEEDELHVFVNSNIKLPCFPTSDVHLSPSEADHVKYTWTMGDDKPITDGRVTENVDGQGTLAIDDANLNDAGNYSCDVEYINPDTGHRTEETFTHVVTVVTLPIVTVRTAVHYRAAVPCDAGLLELFELYLPQQVEDAVCDTGTGSRLCTVQVHSPVCHSNTAPSQGAMEMSVNYEVYIHRLSERRLSSDNSSVCDANCHLIVSFNLLQLFKESMAEVALVPVSSDLDHSSGVFSPVKSSVKIKYIFGCLGGYHLDRGFCVPCPARYFSEDGATECSPCPPGTYQISLGARRCVPCSRHWIPICNELVEGTNMIMVAVVVFIVVFLLVAFLVWYNVFVKQKHLTTQHFSKMLRSPTTKRKAKFGKSQKRARRDIPKVSYSQELETLLNSSGDETVTDDATEITDDEKKSKSKKRRERKKKLIEGGGVDTDAG